ncbi:MAG: hypothetical protein KBA06_05605, partial [Saprospiraceae bacterium]|nr:hypothetical protein [Saprospiraceae bacterium]
NMDYLLSLMYRLDIDERKINYAISPTASDAPNVGLAKLIIQRQKQRVFTKKTIKPAAIHEEDEELNELLW